MAVTLLDVEGTRAYRWALAVVVVVVGLTGCGDPQQSESSGNGAAGTAEPESPGRPFILEGLSADYVPVFAGAGEDRAWNQDWATDWGSDSPFIVLQQDDRRVKVEAFGLEYEEQAAESGQLPARGPTSGQWTFSERLSGDGIARRPATSRDVGVAELDRLLEGVEAEGRRFAPSVGDLPDGWVVVGGSDADVVMSMDGGLGPVDGFGAIWARGDPNIDGTPRLTAASLAGDAAEVRAWEGDLYAPVNWFGDAQGELVEVDSREAAFVALGKWEGGPNHVLLSRMEDGSLLILTSSGNELRSREQLIALAASARLATAQEWQELEDQANRP